ncbi:MAG: DUF5658 family protein [Candidatus Bathyarchaeota archaeon]|nr:DUF5658 family protein [Candidatus Bathyarchaeota archaeon]
MIKKDLLFPFALILVGVSDWLTTILGVTFYGASETNPLMAGLVGSNMMVFSVVKLFAVITAGFAFYKAVDVSIKMNWMPAKRLLDVSFLATFLMLTGVVVNNVTVIL